MRPPTPTTNSTCTRRHTVYSQWQIGWILFSTASGRDVLQHWTGMPCLASLGDCVGGNIERDSSWGTINYRIHTLCTFLLRSSPPVLSHTQIHSQLANRTGAGSQDPGSFQALVLVGSRFGSGPHPGPTNNIMGAPAGNFQNKCKFSILNWSYGQRVTTYAIPWNSSTTAHPLLHLLIITFNDASLFPGNFLDPSETPGIHKRPRIKLVPLNHRQATNRTFPSSYASTYTHFMDK